MRKLLKEFGYHSDMQYFGMIAYNFKQGNHVEAIEYFDKMNKANKVLFLKNATVGGWKSEIPNKQLETLFDLV